MQRPLLLLALTVLLSACSQNLEQLKQAKPTVGDFNASLATEYLAFSESEHEQGRFIVSEKFAKKGLAASRGETVAPDEISTFLPIEDRNKLSVSRAALVNVLNEDIKDAMPQRAARTQLLFDCWQQQLLSSINQKLAPCGDEFVPALTELEDADAGARNVATHRVVFASKSAKLDARAQKMVRNVVNKTKTAANYSILIDGHAGELGNDAEQKELVEQRELALRAALVEAGLIDSRVTIAKTEPEAKPVVLGSEAPRSKRSVDIILTLSSRKI